jgi:predicted ribosomally synthesized peptide with SipW-like signal peptide
MKKIIGLAISAILIMTVTSLGTWAYFQDSESANTNSITAGTMDLKLNGGDSEITLMTLTNQAPGASGTASATLQNIGTLPGKLSMSFSTVSETGGSSGEYAGSADLAAATQISPWIDTDNDEVFDVGTDYALKSDGTVVTSALQPDVVTNFSNRSWSSVIASMPASMPGVYTFRLYWSIPAGTGNTIQGDSFTFNITFTLDQIP